MNAELCAELVMALKYGNNLSCLFSLKANPSQLGVHLMVEVRLTFMNYTYSLSFMILDLLGLTHPHKINL